ncbi:MAG: two-component sensor histidine kinase, partial [Mycobacterium sp.]|nr:two-component sensor histidine kinase [Mycobacterium sp.]
MLVAGATRFLDRPFYHFDMRVIGKFARRPYKVDPVHFLGIPWAAVALWQTGLLVIVIAAIVQRGSDPLVRTVFAGLLAIVPIFYYLRTARPISPVAATSPAIIAVAVLIWTQQVKFDVAPLILVFLLGAAAARRLVAVCVVTTSAGTAMLVGASITHRIDGVAVYLILLATALAVGYFVAIERDLFLAERRARRTLRQHAADEERRRIAREIHDVVVHSLSITLLHVTGARRELQQDGDVSDAVGALVDAERLGRYAMADIRRTIGLLNTGPTSMTPEPGIDDITDLIRDFETAGLALDYRIDGDYARVTPSTGLGIYRI